jgi:hypothetical protein
MNEKLLDGCNSKITYNYIKHLETMDENNRNNKKKDNKDISDCGIEVESEKNGCFSMDECLVCYEKLGKRKTVGCKLCEYRCHKECYKRFTKKNQYFLMRCLHCQTRTVDYACMKKRYLCCFC